MSSEQQTNQDGERRQLRFVAQGRRVFDREQIQYIAEVAPHLEWAAAKLADAFNVLGRVPAPLSPEAERIKRLVFGTHELVPGEMVGAVIEQVVEESKDEFKRRANLRSQIWEQVEPGAYGDTIDALIAWMPIDELQAFVNEYEDDEAEEEDGEDA